MGPVAPRAAAPRSSPLPTRPLPRGSGTANMPATTAAHLLRRLPTRAAGSSASRRVRPGPRAPRPEELLSSHMMCAALRRAATSRGPAAVRLYSLSDGRRTRVELVHDGRVRLQSQHARALRHRLRHHVRGAVLLAAVLLPPYTQTLAPAGATATPISNPASSTR